MRFNNHSDREGSHSVLSASSSSWIRYDDEKFEQYFENKLNAMKGTALHEFARQAIKLRIKLPDVPKTLNMYVNDCIGFKMIAEQILMYSPNAFGTADAIRLKTIYNEDYPEGIPQLLIFDLKTGTIEAKFDQLIVYAAYFCLEYGFKPGDLDIEMRIYQNDDVKIEKADLDDVLHVMDRIIVFDNRINQLKAEVFGA